MMNLGQLSHHKDSLQLELNKVEKQFYRTLLFSNYFRRENSRTNDSINKEPLNIDMVYDSLSLREKERTISQALSFARSAKSYVESHQITYRSKMQRIKRFEVEWHRKFTLSFACLIFFFIGAPLGAIIRKGGFGTPVVISVVFFVLYYVISLMGEKLVRETFEPALKGMWLSSYILLPLGVFLTYKATTDSVILNLDTYLNFWKKIISFNKKKLEPIRKKYR